MQPVSFWIRVTINQSCLKGTGLINLVAAPHKFTYNVLGTQASICPILHCDMEIHKTSHQPPCLLLHRLSLSCQYPETAIQCHPVIERTNESNFCGKCRAIENTTGFKTNRKFPKTLSKKVALRKKMKFGLFFLHHGWVNGLGKEREFSLPIKLHYWNWHISDERKNPYGN